MRTVLTHPDLLVLDDVLPDASFIAIWEHLQGLPYTQPIHDSWIKAWRTFDSLPLVSPTYLGHDIAHDDPFYCLSTALARVATEHTELFGVFGQHWFDILMNVYLYPRGSRLPWHTDEGYSGAMVFYAHPHWSASWGGELLVAEPSEIPFSRSASESWLDHSEQDAYLLERGISRAILPKPNRLVCLKRGVHHMLARVDPDAGDHVRCTISGFLTSSEKHCFPSPSAPCP